MKAQKQPNEMHPYGYARDQFIWPLISAVGIFCCGAGVSFVHGVTGLFEAHRELGDLYWNFVVLGVSGVLESHSLYVAVNTLRRRAAQQGMNLLSYIKTGADPAAVAVMMEDSAAVAGLFIAAGCLALCQATGAVYWDAVGSIAVSALLGVVAVTLIQRNRKWLIGKSMPKAQEDMILEHLANDHVIRQVSNIKSEELGVRQYRFQADIAFDGEELARRALDRCGRTRLFKALDAAVRRHDPHALDALLMQFAAVIVSTTGAEVDRLEREITRLVPVQDQDQDHLADLAEYPLGSLTSLDEAQDNVPAWIQAFAPEFADKYSSPSFAAAAAVAAAPAAVASAAAAAAAAAARTKATKVVTGRLGPADAAVMGGNYLSNEQMQFIESGLFDSEGNEQPYIPFCNAMFEKLHPSPGGGEDGKASGSDAADIAQRNRRVIGPEPEGQYKPFCENMFQKLHPDQPTMKPSYVARAMQQQEKEERLRQQRLKQKEGKQ
eukprot:gene6541-6767_t